MHMHTGDDARSSLPEVLLVALGAAFGMQMVRAVAPLGYYAVVARLGLRPALAVAVVLPVVGVVLCSLALAGRLGSRAAVAVAAGGVVLGRLGAQVWSGDQAVVVAFVVF